MNGLKNLRRYMIGQVKFILLIIPVLLFILSADAQTIQSQANKDTSDEAYITKQLPKTPVIKPKKPKPITKEFSGGIRLNTDGWSLFIDKGWAKTDEIKTIDKFHDIVVAQIELSEHKHPKEIRLTNTDSYSAYDDKPKPYIYGKINNFYALKLGFGKRKMIAGKPESGTVSIHWVYLGGLSAGLQKPYYLEAYVPQDNPTTLAKEQIKYSEETKESFLAQQYIVGGAGWTKGWGEIKLIPGIHAKTALHFDFAASTKTKLALELGLGAELYSQNIELMANQKAYPYILNGYVAIQFGKRY